MPYPYQLSISGCVGWLFEGAISYLSCIIPAISISTEHGLFLGIIWRVAALPCCHDHHALAFIVSLRPTFPFYPCLTQNPLSTTCSQPCGRLRKGGIFPLTSWHVASAAGFVELTMVVLNIWRLAFVVYAFGFKASSLPKKSLVDLSSAASLRTGLTALCGRLE